MNYSSICSGIGAAHIAFSKYNIKPLWFAENAVFPSKVLKYHYGNIPNLGDMNNLPELIKNKKIKIPEIIVSGTPCQAFSLAGWKKGLDDSRGKLTLKLIEIIEEADKLQLEKNKLKPILLWENVEGVIRDKSNTFGNLISGLIGLDEQIDLPANMKWEKSGVILGPDRNVAWRMLDAKYFGLPQQRKRVFLISTDKSINPELLLFEKINSNIKINTLIKSLYKKRKKNNLQKELFEKPSSNEKIFGNNKIEIFSEYTDCLYSAYGTKWNGNAAAYNGSLFTSQNNKLRRFSPLECERLMGFPDNYTKIPDSQFTNRYQAIGNSWAIPVIEWLGYRVKNYKKLTKNEKWIYKLKPNINNNKYKLFLFQNSQLYIDSNISINFSEANSDMSKGDIFKMIDTNASENLYLTKAGKAGIINRKNKLKININQRLEKHLNYNH